MNRNVPNRTGAEYNIDNRILINDRQKIYDKKH